MKQDHIDEIRHGESDMNYQTIYLAGGCFWGTEKFFRQFDGIIETEVGYANGPAQEASAPTYEEVCMSSGHAETVRIVYDPAVIPLRKLLDYYFMVIDPVSVNRQGNDIGIQYRTGIYYTDEDQKQIAEEKLSEIKDWFDGYMFGHFEIYNPWSVISYFNNNCRPKAYWSRTSGNEMIGQLIRNANSEMYESLSYLMQGKEIQAVIETDIIYPEINDDPDMIYSFLLVAGYLRIKETISTINDNLICSLAMPNREIKSVFQKEILDSCRAVFSGSLLRNFELAIRTENNALLTETLQNYLLQSASVYDTAYESFYHGTIFGMLAVMSDSFYITSNRESGEGRFDVQLEPHDKKQTGFILEFKSEKGLDETGLKKLAKEGIRQIRDQKYYTNMKYHGIQNITLFGIAFSGKKVSVIVEKM